MKEEEIKSLNIYQRLALITAELDRVKKGLTVEMGGGKSYKAVSEGDVLDAVKPLEEKYRVYSKPLKRDVIESGTIENEKIDYKTKEKYTTKQLFMRVKVLYRFINIDNPSDYSDTESLGDGVDSQDKAPGKAMTYADKYALLKAYKIETGDDPDAKGSEELKGFTKKKEDYSDLPFGDEQYEHDKKQSFRMQVFELLNSKGLKNAVVVDWLQGKNKQRVEELTDSEQKELWNHLIKL